MLTKHQKVMQKRVARVQNDLFVIKLKIFKENLIFLKDCLNRDSLFFIQNYEERYSAFLFLPDHEKTVHMLVKMAGKNSIII